MLSSNWSSRPILFEKPIHNGGSPVDDHGDRILKWNSHGIVMQTTNNSPDDDTKREMTEDFELQEVAVHVRFHDTSVHHNLRLDNQRHCCLADLSRRALALSCSKVLHVQHFDPQFEDSEWSLELPRGEHAKALALGEDFVVVATDKRRLRFFTLEGSQRTPVCIPGPVHALAASGNSVAVVYRRRLPLPSTQELEVMVLNVSQVRTPNIEQLPFSPTTLPVSNNSTLEWVGFSDQGTLATLDSHGAVRLLKNGLACGWIEVANLKKDLPDKVTNYFMIGVNDLHEQIRCVPCHKSLYPNPRNLPLMQIKCFSLPFCPIGSYIGLEEKQKLEEKYQRANIRQSLLNSMLERQNVHHEYKECLKSQADSLFKLFLYGWENNRESLSLDAATLIPSQKTIESLLNFSKSKKIERLIPRLSKVIDELHHAAPEPMQYVYLSSFASSAKSRHLNDDGSDNAMVLRPLTYIPESDSNDAKNDDDLDEANSKSVFDQSVLVDLDMNASMLEPDPAETKSSESEVASKENDASYQLELAKLEASVLGNKSIPDLVGDVQNPFKSDKQNLKRKLEANDILMKKKKM